MVGLFSILSQDSAPKRSNALGLSSSFSLSSLGGHTWRKVPLRGLGWDAEIFKESKERIGALDARITGDK